MLEPQIQDYEARFSNFKLTFIQHCFVKTNLKSLSLTLYQPAQFHIDKKADE